MRRFLILAVLTLAAACQRTPEQQQADEQRSEAEQRSSAIKNRADNEADRLQQRGAALRAGAKQAGGLTGERLRVRGEALAKEAKIVRKQGHMQADAIKEDAEARIKTSESR